jgi:hypothetical protein
MLLPAERRSEGTNQTNKPNPANQRSVIMKTTIKTTEKSKWTRRWEAFFEVIELGIWLEFWFG